MIRDGDSCSRTVDKRDPNYREVAAYLRLTPQTIYKWGAG